MPVPWLRLLDVGFGLADLARGRSPRQSAADIERVPPGNGVLGRLEMGLFGAVVAALKEVFDRDSRRLELEREQMEAERKRAERALALELLRQTADREIGRLRLVSALAAAGWIGSLLFAARLAGLGTGGRVAIGVGWVLLLAAIASALSAQGRVAGALDRLGGIASRTDDVSSGLSGAIAVWLLVVGLAFVSLGFLLA